MGISNELFDDIENLSSNIKQILNKAVKIKSKIKREHITFPDINATVNLLNLVDKLATRVVDTLLNK